MNYIVEEINNRFYIKSKDGKILDDANGYGFKTKRNAIKGYEWKQKPKKDWSESINYFKENPDILSTLDDFLWYDFKDNNHDPDYVSKPSILVSQVEESLNIKIPTEHKRYIYHKYLK